MSILVIAEHSAGQLNTATLNAVTAASKIAQIQQQDVHLLVAGYHCHSIAEQVQNIAGVTEVHIADHACYQHQLVENVASLVVSFLQSDIKKYSHLLTIASTTGKNLMPRIAALCGVEQISDIVSIESETVFKRPIYAGNVIATVESKADLHILTVRATCFEAAIYEENAESITIHSIHTVCDEGLSEFISQQQVESDRPDLGVAEVVISGGRGMASADNFQLLYQLADKLNAAVGATRAAVDAGFAANDMQVGQTGKIVAPKLYIAVGLSGAIQHLAGMKDSKVIVAINKDENAPIFEVADYGLVADLFTVIPQITKKV